MGEPGNQKGNPLGRMDDLTERKRAETVSDQRARELAALQALGLSVSASLSLKQISMTALGGLLEAVQPDLAYLFLREGERLVLQGVSPAEAMPRLGAVSDHRVGECLCGLAVREGRPIYSPDIHRDRRCTREECRQAGIRSFAALPLRSREEIFGVIGLASLGERDFEIQGAFLETLAQQISIALANARLFEAARKELTERQEAEKKLRASEARYRRLADNALDEEKFRRLIETTDTGYVIIDEEGRVIDANQEYVRLTGRPRLEEVIGHRVLEWTSPHDLDRNANEVRKCVEQGFVRHLEVDYVSPVGQQIPIEINATVLAASGSLQILCLCRDISDRRRMEERLREKEEHFRLLIKNSNDIITVLDENGRQRFVGGPLERILGYQPSDVFGTFGFDLIHPGDVQKAISVFADGVKEPGAVRSMEYRYRHKEGHWVHLEAVGTNLLLDPHVRGVVLNIRDITERKRSEESLRASELNYQEVFNASNDAIFVHEPSTGAIVDVNQAMLQMYGYARQEVLHLNIEDFSRGDPPYSQTEAGEWVRKTRVDGPQRFEWIAKRKSGDLFWVEVNLKSAAIGEQDRILAVVRDISDRKQAEKEKEKLQAQLLQAQKMESVARLAGGVAHDFNNMLTAILGHAELAMMRCTPTEPIQADLQAIKESAQRSAALTRQLLAFARRQTVAPKVLDLNDTVAGTLNMLLRLIGEDIDLVWMPGASLWPIRIDPSQVDQILANLCVNARDAIAGVGKVTIETENTFFDEAYCAIHPGLACGEYVLLAVSDDGCGMKKDVLEHLFEPFFTTKEVGKGTGLGLATVYGIVKQNEGFVNVYSEPDSGSTFKIYLPRFTGEVRQPRAASAEEIPKGRGETVVLVEDEPVILNVGRAMLKRLGYTVLAAGTPAEALRLARVHAAEIQLLITDVVMPEMNGRELAKRIQDIKPGLKCLFTSGYTANVIAHRGELDDGVHFLQKPFSMRDLAFKARQALERD